MNAREKKRRKLTETHHLAHSVSSVQMQHAELPHVLEAAARDAFTIMASCHDGLHPQTTIHRKKFPFIFFMDLS